MDITVVDADGLPDKAYLSIRAGDVRKQVQFKPGVVFDLKVAPKHFVVDVFEKVGSKQVSLSDLAPSSDTEGPQSRLEVPGRGGYPIKLDMKVKVRDAIDTADEGMKKGSPKRVSRHQAALEAKSYLDRCGVQKVLQGMVHEMLSEQPADAIGFMTSYLQDLAANRPANEVKQFPPQELQACMSPSPLPDFSERPGLGEEELDGLTIDATSLPDIAGHHSVMAAVLKQDPALFSRLQAKCSTNGVSLAKCIKPGVDHKGHPMVRTVGLVAGDASCYEVFKDIFDPVITRLHTKFSRASPHVSDLDPTKVTDLPLDADGCRVVSVQVHGSRCLGGGLRMPTAASLEELCEVERLLSQALVSLGGDLAGEYHPLRGSTTWAAKPVGMSSDDEHDLRTSGFLFEEPDSAMNLSAGYGRRWPHARGVFLDRGRKFFAWVNEADHLKICSRMPGGDLKQAFERFVRVERAVSESLRGGEHDYLCDGHLGFLNSCPSNLGTALHISAVLRIPLLGGHAAQLKGVCKRLGLQARVTTSSYVDEDVDRGALWELSNHERLGCSEIGQIDALIAGCRELTAIESKLEAGHDPAVVFHQTTPAQSTEWERPEREEFPADICPDAMPDLSGKHSMAADVLRTDPSIYDRLKAQTTPMGVSLATCVKTCFDNSGHPMIKTIGAVAGDELCYDTFQDFFEPVIQLRHPSYSAVKGHSTDLDWTKVSSEPLDPDASGRVVSVRVRLNRNLHGVRMPPACLLDERREVERAVVQTLLEQKGEYFPLRGSGSYPPKPGGMTAEEEDRLDAEHLLFDEPDSQVLLSSGFGRDWPDARGVFVGEDRRMLVWVNESDHLRMQAMQEGSDLRGVFERLCRTLGEMEAALKATGHSFSRNERLGFLGACPSNLGTCLAASAIIRIPLLSAQPQFRAFCRQLRLQAHLGIAGGLAVTEGVWEVLNSERLGSSEVEQVNTVISGCRALLVAEARLQRGELLELDLLAASAAPLDEQADENEDADADEEEYWEDEGDELPGLGEDDFPGFPADECPEDLPYLGDHHSLVATVIKNDPSIYPKLKGLRTAMDVSLARCIKTGMDNVGHPMILTTGIVAGDAECYDLFAELFNPVIQRRHVSFDPSKDRHASNMDLGAVRTDNLDPAGGYVKKVQVWADRNIQSLRFPPAASAEDRVAAERVLTAALRKVPGLDGEYYPLRGSGTHSPNPDGMSEETEKRLTALGLVPQPPDSNVTLASGAGRFWPRARGVFTSPEGDFAAFINQEAHIRLKCSMDGPDLRGTFARFCEVEQSLKATLKQDSLEFAESPHLGYLTVSPGDLGTAMHVEVAVRLDLVCKRPGFRDLCRRCKVIVRCSRDDQKGLMCVLNRETLGSSEMEQVNVVIHAVRHLVSLEAQLQQGAEVDLSAPVPGIDDQGDQDGAEEGVRFKSEVEIESVREWAKSALMQAAGDGSLESALHDAQMGPPEDEEDDAATREKAKDSLMKALEDGRLDLAIASAIKGEQEQPEEDMDTVKDRAKSALSEALQSGLLDSVLKSVMLPPEEAPPFSEDVPGLGSADVPGFPTDVCPEELPDLSAHHSIAAVSLRNNPAVYASLKGLSTKLGVSLARCIKPGMDNRGHPMVKTAGLVAGDEECYQVYKDLFDPVIKLRHGGFDPALGVAHPVELDAAALAGVSLDPTGRFVMSASVQAGRNIKDMCFLPAVSREQRKEIERMCVAALQKLEGDTSGEYYSLADMDRATRAELESKSLLFDTPDSALTLSSGYGREWPESRGIFANEERTLVAWVNQDDHLQLIASEPGAGLGEAFRRFTQAEGAVRQALHQEGREFARSDGLGFLSADPSRAGSGGFQARILIQLSLAPQQADFKAVCKGLQVAVKETEEPGVWSILKMGFLGQSEVDVLKTVATACQKLVEMEVALEKGEGSS